LDRPAGARLVLPAATKHTDRGDVDESVNPAAVRRSTELLTKDVA
jgi:hypothetical protein